MEGGMTTSQGQVNDYTWVCIPIIDVCLHKIWRVANGKAIYVCTGAHNEYKKEEVGVGSAHANNWIQNSFPR